MAARATVTQTTISRTVKAATTSGLPVDRIVVRPDGTVIVHTVPVAGEETANNDWDEVLETPS